MTGSTTSRIGRFRDHLGPRPLKIAIVALIASLVGIVILASAGAGTSPARSTRDAPSSVANTPAFNVSQLGWAEATDGDEILTTEPGQPERLTRCGSDAWESSMLVLAPEGIAYCIEPVGPDPDVRVAARLLAMELLKDTTFSDAQVEVLRLQTLLGYAEPESVDAARYRNELQRAVELLTPKERVEILGY
jgi:hypothetical protein